MNVEIAIKPNSDSPAKMKLVVCNYEISCAGHEKKANGSVCLENATNKEAVLTALRDALKRFIKPCTITLRIGNPWVRAQIARGNLEKWKENGYLKSDGTEIAYRKLWEEIAGLLSAHEIKMKEENE